MCWSERADLAESAGPVTATIKMIGSYRQAKELVPAEIGVYQFRLLVEPAVLGNKQDLRDRAYEVIRDIYIQTSDSLSQQSSDTSERP